MDFTPVENRMTPLIKPEGAMEKSKTTPAIESFGNYLKNAIGKVNTIQKHADDAIKKLTTGEKNDIHTTMIAMQKASISFEMLMQVRNKVISAYDEIKRMQL